MCERKGMRHISAVLSDVVGKIESQQKAAPSKDTEKNLARIRVIKELLK